MPLSLDEFWTLAERSLIFDPGELAALRQQFDQQVTAIRGRHSRAAAEWLVKQHRLTVYQAQTLLRGHPGPFQFGEYRVLQPRLVVGDLASRWNAIHVGTRHRVLLHLWPESDTERWPAAKQQADAARRIRHPNLDRVYTTVVTRECRMAVSEWPEGRSLRELLQQRKRFPVPQACWLVQQIASGLVHLHALGYDHGRLSDSEAIVQPGGHVKLLRAPWGGASTPPSDPLRAPPPSACRYRAPEFLQPGTKPDALSDVYALGCLCYQLITGRVPFDSDSAEQIMAEHATRRIEPLEKFAPVPAGLTELVAFMMAKRRELRVSDMTEVVDKLNAFVPQGARQTVPRAWATESYYLAHLQQAVFPASVPPPVVPVAAAEDDRPSVVVAVDPTERVAARTARRTERADYRAWVWPALGMAALGLALTLWMSLTRHGGGRQAPRLTVSPAPPEVRRNTVQSRAVPDGNAAPRAARWPRDRRPEQSEVLLVDDDGQTLWASPTAGQGIDVSYAPPDSQMFIFVRPAELAAVAEGPAIIQSLGPEFAALRLRLENQWGLQLSDIEQLLIAFRPRDVGPPEVTCRLQLAAEIRKHILAQTGEPRSSHSGQVLARAEVAAFFPSSPEDLLVIGPTAWIDQLAARSTATVTPPPLRRQLETLRAASDAERHFTILAVPNFLAADGRAIWADVYAPLREPLVELLGEETSAVSMSLHVGHGTYVELRLIGAVEDPPLAVAEELRERLRQLPDEVTRYLERLPLERFWQPLAIRFPRMLQFSTDQIRIGADRSVAVLNAVVPPGAAHNLILASELALANGRGDSAPTGERKTLAIEAILAEPIGLQVDQQSLDRVVQELTESVRSRTGNQAFSIQIVGADLELEGITRNQQIRDLNVAAQPLRQTLTELVRRANPVAVADPRQEAQRLVWVVAPDQNATVLLTTRSAAAEKRHTLPAEFVAVPPGAGLQ